jgi:hypothetical protein
MNELAQVIADLVRAGTDPALVGRLAAAIANVRHIDEQAERRRAADRARKAACKSGIPQNSAESAEQKESFPHTPFKEKINTTTRARGKSDLADDWEPDGKTWKLAEQLGFTSQEAWDQLERMRDWAKNADGSKGRKSDWNAAFRNWLKRTADERKLKPQASVQRNSNANAVAILDAAFDQAIARASGFGAEGGEENLDELPGLRKSAA